MPDNKGDYSISTETRRDKLPTTKGGISMAIPVLILGRSGSGKSTSLRNFKKEEVGIIRVLNKPLPFKSDLQSMVSDSYDKIKGILKVAKSKSLIIDDANYLMTNQFMRGHSTTGAGNAIFSFYNIIGDSFWSLIEYITTLPDEKIVYIMMHEEESETGNIKPKSIGKMLDEKVCIEGMFTIVLRCKSENGKHFFTTVTDGHDVCKTPIGMFETEEIDNDLKFVDATIRNYYELG